MRIVMPLHDFINEENQEFSFGDGKYSIRRFDSSSEVPPDLPGLSEMDRSWIELEEWCLVAENPDLGVYREQVNLLLLAFRLETLAKAFIKYRICREDSSLCSVVQERANFVPSESASRIVTAGQFKAVDVTFARLLEMYGRASNRTHNALYFLYGAYFVANHWAYTFILLFSTLEALFSKEERGGATRAICSRVSAFLGSKPRCTYQDVEMLYDIRSELVHGKRRLSLGGNDSNENLRDTHELEFVVTECVKKILVDRVYDLYADSEQKEKYFNELVEPAA